MWRPSIRSDAESARLLWRVRTRGPKGLGTLPRRNEPGVDHPGPVSGPVGLRFGASAALPHPEEAERRRSQPFLALQHSHQAKLLHWSAWVLPCPVLAANAVIIKYPQIIACQFVGLGRCSPNLVVIAQMVAMHSACVPLFVWILLYFDHAGYRNRAKFQWRVAAALFGLYFVWIALCATVGAFLLYGIGICADETRVYGSVLGYVAVVANIIQWAPQIYTTFRRRSAGSFSLPMLLMQMPGTLVFLFFMIFVTREHFSTWIAMFSATIQMTILLVLLIVFHPAVKRRFGIAEAAAEEEEDGLLETAPQE